MAIEILRKILHPGKEKKPVLTEEELIARMEKMTAETRVKRAARVGKEPEVPSNITSSKRNKDGFIEISFTFHDQEHKVKGRGTVEEFKTWITEYVKTAETCTTCDQILFPGSYVGVGEDGGYTHMTDECSLDLIMLAGRVNATGQIEIPKEWMHPLPLHQKENKPQ